MKKNKYFLMAIILLFMVQSACVKKPDTLPETAADNRPLLTIIKNNFAFSMFYSALQRTGLDKTLQGTGPFTVLAPDNDAFTASGITADSLSRIDTATLKKLISYHIIPINIPYASIPQAVDFSYKTIAGPLVYFSEPIAGDNQFENLTTQIIHINGVTVIKANIAASNGTIYALAKVLYYPATSIKAYLQGMPQYSYFVEALKQFGLFDQLDQKGPFVVMAPNNNAFTQYGLNPGSIAKLDTLEYKKFLFGGYILPAQLFFMTDFMDAPLAMSAPPGLLTPDFIQVVSNNTYGIESINYLYIESYYYQPPYYGDAYIYGPAVNIIDPDHVAVNGVIDGVDGLAIVPDSVKMH